MIGFDLSQVQSLSLAGVLYDIAGAMILSRAFIWSRVAALVKQTQSMWTGNPNLLRALCEQATDAKWGASLLVAGFLMQAATSAGVKISMSVAAVLLGALVLAVC